MQRENYKLVGWSLLWKFQTFSILFLFKIVEFSRDLRRKKYVTLLLFEGLLILENDKLNSRSETMIHLIWI